MNENTITRFNRFAVRFACVVQETCAVPPRLPSITRPSESPNTKVWPASARCRAAARRQLVNSPLYSISCSPAAMGRSAKSPLPCTDERRADMRRCCMCEVRLGVGPIIAVLKSDAKHIASFLWRPNLAYGHRATNCLARQRTIQLRQKTCRQKRGTSGHGGAFQDNSRVAGPTHVR
jgi:hypothetical protein